MPTSAATTVIEQLNNDCFCFSLDPDALARALDAELGQPGLSALMRERCPSVFAARPVFVAAPQLQRIAQVVRAVEAVIALPAYREQVLAAAPAIARIGAGGPQGAFFGYDFHLDQGRLGLIEINTNAGGAMLNAVLARAQRSCCAAMDTLAPTPANVAAFEQRLVDMFHREWLLAGHARPLRSIAIVDEQPEQQYLYPEFLLFQRLFERHGLKALVTDPSELQWRGGVLWHGELAIDLVYNRLTDFYLERPACAALREAYEQHGVVLTPHPQAHALYADKRQLALFSNAEGLQALGVPDAIRQVLLDAVPHTEVVTAANSERLWAARRGLFFKPVAGFGSRAAYRGDKLTKRVWQEILGADYVAQAIVPPGQRRIDESDGAQPLKFDLRAYAYGGEVQWVAARLYQGQATNFRTPGGGFAPVFSTVDALGCTPRDGEGGHAPSPCIAGHPMLLRIWKVSLAPGKAEELETFANTISLPMFKAQPGCLAVFFTRTASECATVTVWSSVQSVEAMERSAQYQRVVRQIEESGILEDDHVTEVFSVYGGFTTEGLRGLLSAAGGSTRVARSF